MSTPANPAQAMWEERYGVDHYVYGTEPNGFLREQAARLAPGRALCIAEGEGRNSVHLAEHGWTVTSVELTEAGVAKTRRLAAERGVTVDAHQADVQVFDLGSERWDLIVSIFAHMPPKVRADLHHRITNALAPGGTLILEAYTPDQIGRGTGGPSIPEMTMTLDGLRAELAPLDFVHTYEGEREVVEGPGHSGIGVVVQVVARRVT